ncbi:SDR family NAD(P)-dependent oxidoreductase [Taklimakanibacter lacteus]|uniref:SDR family NAD(P)-dependent oxidoreductase n=1 Tax=Taklimakanibacter lacteus TaxID=2268456 RepID=UPI000E661F24
MSAAIYPSLKGKTVFITGGAMGIGESIVEEFARQGARVAFVDIAKEAGEKLKNRLAGDIWFGHCDVTDIPALQKAIAEAAKALGPITILVNNAAHDERHAWDRMTPDYWDQRIAINLKHQFFAAQAVIPMMQKAGGGSIINLGSCSWKIGQGGMAAYTASKSGVTGLTRSLARDLGPDNIRVNTISPGWIMTERQLKLWVTPEGEKKIMENQCLKRKLLPVDIARVALFLASDESGACTNQDFTVDGGWV